jgi:hypothetical protein
MAGHAWRRMVSVFVIIGRDDAQRSTESRRSIFAEAPPKGMGFFRNRQDCCDNGDQELDDFHHPGRDKAIERRALAKRAGHVTIPLGGGEKQCARQRQLRAHHFRS